jgi:hypothetical protein
VTIWGATNDQFSVSVDDAAPTSYNVTEGVPVDRPNALLFHASGLASGQHSIQVVKMGRVGSYLDLDDVQVSSLAGSQSIANPAIASMSASASASV